MADTTPAPTNADALRQALELCSAELFAQCADQPRAMQYVEQARAALATAAQPPAADLAGDGASTKDEIRMTDNKQYLELPTHFMLVQESFRDEVYLYTADQMRAYYDLGYAAGEKAAGLQRVSDFCVLQETLETADTLRADLAECRQSLKRAVSTLHAHELAEIGAPNYAEDPAEPRYDRPVGYLPAYELSRLHSGHDAQLRSAKFGPSALDGDVPVYLESSALALVQALIGAQRAINSMKAEAETAAQGDEQMMLDACEQISNEGLEASLAIQAALSTAAQPPADGALNTIAAMFHSGEEIEGPDGLAIMVDMDERLEP